MPPGSPGIFRRRKSSAYEVAHNCLVFEQNSVVMSESSTSEASQEVSQSQANPVTPWPNCKDDYELKEIIGKIFIHYYFTFVVIFFKLSYILQEWVPLQSFTVQYVNQGKKNALLKESI